jgi:hypothetical protein
MDSRKHLLWTVTEQRMTDVNVYVREKLEITNNKAIGKYHKKKRLKNVNSTREFQCLSITL